MPPPVLTGGIYITSEGGEREPNNERGKRGRDMRGEQTCATAPTDLIVGQNVDLPTSRSGSWAAERRLRDLLPL